MSESVKPVDPHAALKRQAAEYAVRYVESGMAVGLGTGSTAIFAVRYIGELLRSGTLKDIVAFATSQVSWDEAVRLGIPMLSEGSCQGPSTSPSMEPMKSILNST